MDKVINAVFRSDAGHGWLQVSIEDLVAVSSALITATEEIAEFKLKRLEISQYSYLDSSFVYLEEDCDAPRFLSAAKSVGFEVKITEKSDGDNSPIRHKARLNMNSLPQVF